jgi:hypothetical protein
VFETDLLDTGTDVVGPVPHGCFADELSVVVVEFGVFVRYEDHTVYMEIRLKRLDSLFLPEIDINTIIII